MPDVREVYEMVTKQKQPEPGALQRQQKRQVRSGRNRRFSALAVAAAIAVAAVVLILETRRGPHTTSPVNRAPTPSRQPTLPVPSSHPFFLDLRTGETRPLAGNLAGGYSYVASPDGTKIAYGTNRGGGCGVTDVIVVANIDGTGARTLQAPNGFINCAPRWSPDGTKLVYQQRAATEDSVGNLYVEDLSTGQTTQLTHLKLTRAWWYFLAPRFTPGAGPADSPETGPGNVIFHLPRSSSKTTTWDVWSVPVTGGEPTLVLRNAAFPMLRAQGPEGLRIQFVSPMPNNVVGRRIMTGRPIPDSDIRQPLVQAKTSIWWPTLSPDGNKIAYRDGESIYILDIPSDRASVWAKGSTAEWLDNHTLIVAP